MRYLLSMLLFAIAGSTFHTQVSPESSITTYENELKWGQIGHRVVAQIAQNHLTPEANKAVRNLLGEASMAEVSVWADAARGTDTYSYTRPWHYTTIPDGETYETAEKNPEGDVITALRKYEKILRNAGASRQEKAIALKFYIHFAGDIHQPLHVGNGRDRGGNDVDVNWFGEEARLHSVWDSEIIRHLELSFTEFVLFLETDDAEKIKKWQQADYVDWAMESYRLREQVYRFSSSRNNDDEPYLGWDYRNKAVPIVKKRMLQAGIRLAGKLNEIFS